MIKPRYYRYNQSGDPEMSRAGMAVLMGLEAGEIREMLALPSEEDIPEAWWDCARSRLEALSAELGYNPTLVRAIDIFCAREGLPQNTQPPEGYEPVPDVFGFYIGGPLSAERIDHDPDKDPDDRYVAMPFIMDGHAIDFFCWKGLGDPEPLVQQVCARLADEHGMTTTVVRAGTHGELMVASGMSPEAANEALDRMRPQMIIDGLAHYDANGNFIVDGREAS